MNILKRCIFVGLFSISLVLKAVGQATITFGDDTSEWAYDGECDDPRFQGSGTAVTLLDKDRFRDATDCRLLFNQNRITLRNSARVGGLTRTLFKERSRLTGANESSGKIYGIFVGISDYPGDSIDLQYTAEDAIRVHGALIKRAGMNPSDAIVLTDSNATVDNLRAAMEEIAQRAGPEDSFIFFYSGHGDRLKRADGPQVPQDPDGFDETLRLYDHHVLDDELASMFDWIDAGISLAILDSCFSGGFAKDLISSPGRMGLFSSEEDVESSVASEFRSGGYLSLFFDQAVGDSLADSDTNGQITAHELSEFLHESYRTTDFTKTITQDSGRGEYVSVIDNANYQHLVVDRGGISVGTVLFEQR